MRLSQRLLTVLLACFLPTFAAFARSQEADSPAAAVFPAVTSYALDKSRVDLPTGLAGQYNILLLSFEQEQQNQVSSWMPAAEAAQHTHFNVRYYQLPVFPRENVLYRWWENSSMRSDVTDPEMWPWIVPLYVEQQPFLRALGIENRKEAVVLLVDKSGRVLWKSSGSLTEEKRSQLEKAVAGVTGH
ncbi:MAG: hypothetical protein HIU87_02125 [Acidobacteria bacterium]|nr:hypothetical protein [Acidobacteriota bacterium]